MTSPIVIRAVAPAETLSLRREMLRPDRPLCESIYIGDEDSTTIHLGAFVGDNLIAVASLYPEALPESVEAGIEATGDRTWRLRGMAVQATFHGQGYGRQLLNWCLQSVARQAGSILWCNARSPAVGFYRAAGFQILGSEFIIAGIGSHFVMARRVQS